MSDSQAYASAIERAQQINSKLSEGQYYQGASSQAGMKRSAQQSYDQSLHSTEKRPFLNDKTASAAAAEAVARLNQKLGVQQQQPPQLPSMPQSFPGQYAASNQPTTMPGATQTASVTIKIPDRLVGLIIGKRGEQITALQAESNCKVQITQEQTGPERPITLTGLPQQIEHARRMIGDLISRAERGGPPMPHQPQMNSAGAGDNFTQIEILVPGNKAGLVIGKGGETIKSLQEEHGVKMVLIQQSNQATLEDKPLRISGDTSRVERVKQIIVELINGKTTPAAVSGRADGQDFQRYAVPAEKAGLVIGKGGETIKEICKLSNCHVEISKDPPPSQALKLFNIRGSPEDIMKAKKLISDRAGVPLTNDSYGATSGYNVYAYMQDQAQPAAAAAASNGGNMPAPSVNPYTGMLDYSAAWIEYYRRLGMPEQAEKIMMQAQQQSQTGGVSQQSSTVSQQPPQQQTAPATAGAAGSVDYSQQQHWAAWQQWQAWQQQQQQQQGWAGNVPPSGQTN